MKKISTMKIAVVLSYVITITNILVHLIYTPVMIHLLGQSEYGLYTLVGSVVSYLSLFSLGFSGAYLRFYSRFASKNDKIGVARLNGMFLALFMAMGCVALICGMMLSCFTKELFGTNLSAYELGKAEILMRFLVVNISLTFPTSVMNSIITSQEHFLFQRIVTLVSIICNPLICLPLLLVGYGSIAVVAVTTSITIIKLLVDIWYCKKKLHTQFDFSHFNWSLLKEMSGFSFFLFLNMIIDQINWSIDKFILGRVAGTAAVAVYGVGGQINSLYLNFSTAISSVFAPRINRIATSDKITMRKEFTSLFIKVGRIQAIVLLLIASGFVVFGEFFITDVYTSQEYRDAYVVAMFLILPVTIPLTQNLGIEIQRAVNKHKVRSIIYIIMAVLNAIVSIPLAKQFGPIGCAMGTAGSLLLANGLIMNIYYQKAIGIDIIAFWKSISSLCKGMIVPIGLGCFIMNKITIDGIIDFLFWIVIYAFVYIVSMWLLGMNSYEKELIRKPLTRFMKRQ